MSPLVDQRGGRKQAGDPSELCLTSSEAQSPTANVNAAENDEMGATAGNFGLEGR